VIRWLVRNLDRVAFVLRRARLERSFREYVRRMGSNHRFSDFPKTNTGDTSADPREYFSHYEAYSFWLAAKLEAMGNKRKVLDLGNRKLTNALLSVTNDVTSLVLANCDDRISKVKYVIHDISDPLPFADGSFDVFTSLGTLQLVGLGRYGDKLDPHALLNLIAELDRVLKAEAHLIFSTSFGPNRLHFNNGWGFEFETVRQLFGKWRLVDYLIDNGSVEHPPPYEERYTKQVDYQGFEPYRIAFYHFSRAP
jgi:SAM-dependent methyltransferase